MKVEPTVIVTVFTRLPGDSTERSGLETLAGGAPGFRRVSAGARRARAGAAKALAAHDLSPFSPVSGYLPTLRWRSFNQLNKPASCALSTMVRHILSEATSIIFPLTLIAPLPSRKAASYSSRTSCAH